MWLYHSVMHSSIWGHLCVHASPFMCFSFPVSIDQFSIRFCCKCILDKRSSLGDSMTKYIDSQRHKNVQRLMLCIGLKSYHILLSLIFVFSVWSWLYFILSYYRQHFLTGRCIAELSKLIRVSCCLWYWCDNNYHFDFAGVVTASAVGL